MPLSRKPLDGAGQTKKIIKDGASKAYFQKENRMFLSRDLINSYLQRAIIDTNVSGKK